MKSKKQSGPKGNWETTAKDEVIDLLLRMVTVQSRAIEALSTLLPIATLAGKDSEPAAETESEN